MVVEESVTIAAGIKEAWHTFVDLSCWRQWNTVLRDVAPAEQQTIKEGNSFVCMMRSFVLSVYFEPELEEVRPYQWIVWRGRKYGIRARHEFIFRGDDEASTVISGETFTGCPLLFAGSFFPGRKIREMTVSMLRDLKKAVEEDESWTKG